MHLSYVAEISVNGPQGESAAALSWCEDTIAVCRTLSGVTAIDRYRPAAGAPKDPYNDDGRGPATLIYLHFDTEAPLLRAVTAPALCELLRAPPTGVYAGLAAFSRRFYGPDSVLPDQPMTAGFSYVVRYHRPAEDEAAFVAHYVAHHPPLLAMLPAIRAVLCYFPLSEVPVPEGLARPDYMIGNEVVFETIEAFNDAMASPLREEMRRDFHSFPRFTGLVTHFPMDRHRVL